MEVIHFYGGSRQTCALLNRREIALCAQYKQHYGYIFHIGRAV